MFSSIDVSVSGLAAQRTRMDTIAGNIANAGTTRDADGNPSPFQRRFVTFAPSTAAAGGNGLGVKFDVQTDTATPPRRSHQPGHPDADGEGYVAFPAIDLITEFVNAMEAGRAYEANVAALEMSKEMTKTGLRLLA